MDVFESAGGGRSVDEVVMLEFVFEVDGGGEFGDGLGGAGLGVEDSGVRDFGELVADVFFELGDFLYACLVQGYFGRLGGVFVGFLVGAAHGFAFLWMAGSVECVCYIARLVARGGTWASCNGATRLGSVRGLG